MSGGAATRVVFLPDDRPLSWPEYLALEWPELAEPATVALQAAHRHRELFKPFHVDASVDGAESTFAIGAAMIAAICRMQDSWAPPDGPLSAGSADVQVARFLIARAAGLQPDAQRLYSSGEAYLIAMLATQLVVSTPFTLKIRLALRLLDWMSPRPERVEPLLTPSVPVSMSKYLAVCAAILSHAASAVYFHGERSLTALGAAQVSKDEARALLDTLATDALQAGRAFRKRATSIHGLDTGSVAFWLFHPIIHLGTSHYLLAPNGLFVDALVLSTPLRMLDAERRAGSDRTLATAHGPRFERYVADVLRQSSAGGRCETEQNVRTTPHDTVSTPDFTLWDPADPHHVTLLEVKATPLPSAWFDGSDPEVLSRVLSGILMPPVVQVLRSVYRLGVAYEAGHVRESALELCRRILSSKELNIVVVFPFFPSALNSARLHRLVESAIAAELAKAGEMKSAFIGIETWFAKFRATHYLRWIWLQVTDFEMATGWIDGPSLPYLISAFAGHAAARPLLEFSRPAPEKGRGPSRDSFAATFNDWLLNRGCPGDLHPSAKAEVDEFLDRSSALLSQAPNA